MPKTLLIRNNYNLFLEREKKTFFHTIVPLKFCSSPILMPMRGNMSKYALKFANKLSSEQIWCSLRISGHLKLPWAGEGCH